MRINNFKDLIVWQKSMKLVINVYQLIKELPREEKDGIANQMRRSAVSIPSNIAEGYCRYSNKELLQFLYIARGSSAELETQLLIVKRLNLASNEKVEITLTLCEETEKLINAFIKSVKNKNNLQSL